MVEGHKRTAVARTGAKPPPALELAVAEDRLSGKTSFAVGHCETRHCGTFSAAMFCGEARPTHRSSANKSARVHACLSPSVLIKWDWLILSRAKGSCPRENRMVRVSSVATVGTGPRPLLTFQQRPSSGVSSVATVGTGPPPRPATRGSRMRSPPAATAPAPRDGS